MESRSGPLSAARLGRIPTNVIIGVFVICSALPLALLTSFSIALAQDGLRDEVRERLDGVAVASAQSLDKETNAFGDVVESYAARSEIRDALLASRSGVNPAASATLGSQLDQLQVARSGIAVTFVTDAEGRLVGGRPDNPANVGKDFSYRDWYRGASTSNNTYVSEAFESAAPGAPAVVAIAAPVRDAQGNTIGFIGANYGLEAIQDFVGEFAGSQGVELTVTDRRGTIVAAPGALPSGLVSRAADPRVMEALAGQHGVQTWDEEGRNLVSSYAPASDIGWALVADMPASEAFAPVERLRVTVLTSAGMLGLVLVIGLAFLGLTLRERARIERRLQEKSEETLSILEASADAYVAMDESGRIVAWSGQAEDTFGWTASQAIGRLVSETVVPPRDVEAFEQRLREYLESGDGSMLGTRAEATALHKDGHEFPIEIVGWVAKSGDPERTIFSAFCHDITMRREAAAELSTARDRAMEASRLKSEFVANMSHEIRTPMNGVIGMVDLLRRTDLTREQRDYADTVWRSAEALLDVINDILDFSKIEAGRMELDSIPFDPRAVIEEAGELLAGAAQAKGLELATQIDPEVPMAVLGDPGRLRQIVLNLLGNAVKFTEKGEVVARCRIQVATADRVLLRFEISDTGCGIAPENRGRLFESFSQVDTSSTRRHGGTGLGLAISKRLVELMGGEIGVNSVPNEGSTFWFTADLVQPAERRDRRSSGPAELAALRGMRVLVVDDNATNRTILDRMLAAWRMDSKSAAGAIEALSELRRAADEGRPFVVALLDYNMPEIDGLDLAHRIKQDPDLQSTHCLLLTSSGERSEMLAAHRDEIEGCLTKPVREAALFTLVAECIGTATPAAVDGAQSDVQQEAKVRILVVDDNVVNQRVTCVMLEKMGYLVDVASDGSEALAAIFEGAHDYSAVLMDCQMPVMDGYEATRALRRREPAGTHLPVIAITAHAMQGDLDKCLEAGMDDYLSKPIPWDSLQSVIERHVSTDESGGSSVESTNGQVPNVRTIDLATQEWVRNTPNGGIPDEKRRTD